MRFLITGAGGQVGRELAEQCQLTDADVFAFDSNELDICNEEQVMDVVSRLRPDVIFNCAAYTDVDGAEDHKEWATAVNVEGPAYLAEAAKSVDALLIHLSTDYVFDGGTEYDLRAVDMPNPINVYGETKLMGENALLTSGAKVFILRVSWVFGKYGKNFVKTMLRLADTHDEVDVVSDQWGAPTPAEEIVKVMLTRGEQYALYRAGPFGIFHFESNPKVSWAEFAEVIFDIAYHEGVIDYPIVVNHVPSANYPTKARRPLNSKLSSDAYQCEWRKVLHKLLLQLTQSPLRR